MVYWWEWLSETALISVCLDDCCCFAPNMPLSIAIVDVLDCSLLGQSRGFGFVEFCNVTEATSWMEHTKVV